MQSALRVRTVAAPRRLLRAIHRNSTTISTRSGRSSRSMSKVDAAALANPSLQYRVWLKRERRGRIAVRTMQLLVLLVLLVLWEVLPRAQLVNPLLTSYPSALWPTFLQLLKETPQQASILSHTWATVLATVLGFTAAMVVGMVIAAALWWWSALYKVLDPYLVVANAMPKTAFVPIFYVWLGATLSIYGMSLAIPLLITIPMIDSGFHRDHRGIEQNADQRETEQRGKGERNVDL